MSQITRPEAIQVCSLRIRLIQKELAFKRIIQAKVRFLHQIKSVIEVTLEEIDHYVSESESVQKCRLQMDIYLEKLYVKSPKVIKVEQE